MRLLCQQGEQRQPMDALSTFRQERLALERKTTLLIPPWMFPVWSGATGRDVEPGEAFPLLYHAAPPVLMMK